MSHRIMSYTLYFILQFPTNKPHRKSVPNKIRESYRVSLRTWRRVKKRWHTWPYRCSSKHFWTLPIRTKPIENFSVAPFKREGQNGKTLFF